MPLDKLFSPVLADLLQADTSARIADELGISVADMQQGVRDDEDELNLGDGQDDLDRNDSEDINRANDMPTDVNREDDNNGESNPPGHVGDPCDNNDLFTFDVDEDPDAYGIADDEGNGGNNDTEVPVWTSGQFWNFVDHSLDTLRKDCRKNSSDNAEYLTTYAECVTRSILACPRRLNKLPTVPSFNTSRKIYTTCPDAKSY